MIKHTTILQIIRKAGIKAIYSALLLFYAFRRSDLPAWAKTIVFGALGYLLSPLDSIPDLTPLLGYTDDLGVLSYALVMIAAYVNDGVRQKARIKLYKLLGPAIDEEVLDQVERRL
jgi:uncharacterized membrane protein YkvA (DUF1232 family)